MTLLALQITNRNMYGTNIDKVLTGKKINKIFLNRTNLKFETDHGSFVYAVDGDCCSYSEFWDFYGVKNLLAAGPVKEVSEVELDPATGSLRPNADGESTQYYGYKLVAEHPELGDITAVFSFRNMSNGYYGGSLVNAADDIDVAPEITDDVVEAADTK